MWTLLLFCVLILLLSISVCFSPTGKMNFLGDKNKKLQVANWTILVVCVGLANVVRVFELPNVWATWGVNLVLCVVCAVFLFLGTSCSSLMWELFKSFRNALRETEKV